MSIFVRKGAADPCGVMLAQQLGISNHAIDAGAYSRQVMDEKVLGGRPHSAKGKRLDIVEMVNGYKVITEGREYFCTDAQAVGKYCASLCARMVLEK